MYLTKTLSVKQNTSKNGIRDFFITTCVLIYNYIHCTFTNGNV